LTGRPSREAIGSGKFLLCAIVSHTLVQRGTGGNLIRSQSRDRVTVKQHKNCFRGIFNSHVIDRATLGVRRKHNQPFRLGPVSIYGEDSCKVKI